MFGHLCTMYVPVSLCLKRPQICTFHVSYWTVKCLTVYVLFLKSINIKSLLVLKSVPVPFLPCSGLTVKRLLLLKSVPIYFMRMFRFNGKASTICTCTCYPMFRFNGTFFKPVPLLFFYENVQIQGCLVVQRLSQLKSQRPLPEEIAIIINISKKKRSILKPVLFAEEKGKIEGYKLQAKIWILQWASRFVW